MLQEKIVYSLHGVFQDKEIKAQGYLFPQKGLGMEKHGKLRPGCFPVL